MSPTAHAAADVYKAGRKAAVLERSNSDLVFQYLPEYLVPGSEPIAWSLPIDSSPSVFPRGALPPFFSGLLPEGRRLSGLIASLKTSAEDELSLLISVGSSTVGDVVVTPQGVEPQPATPAVSVAGGVSDLSFATLMASGGFTDSLALPGAQDKVSGRLLTLPGKAGTTEVIIKFETPEFPGVVDNEFFFLRWGRKIGLRVPRHHIVSDSEGARALAVTRFDRVGSGTSAASIPVEDATQILGRYPADKYLLGAEEVVQGLSEVCSAPIAAARTLFGYFVFSLLIGNGDLHAKNLAVYQHGGDWKVTPAYDLVSTVAYGDHTMALPLQGSLEFSPQRLVAFAHSLGLPHTLALNDIARILKRSHGLEEELVGEQHGALTLERARESQGTIAYRRKLLAGVL